MSISTAISTSAQARTFGVKTEYRSTRNGALSALPVRIAVFGLPSSGVEFKKERVQLTTATAVGEAFGYGSQLHIAATHLLPSQVPVTFYPLTALEGGTFSEATVEFNETCDVAGAINITIGGISALTVGASVGDTASQIAAKCVIAINSVLQMPVTAQNSGGMVTLTSKFTGNSMNGASFVVDVLAGGTTASVEPFTGGSGSPIIDEDLASMGETWETIVVTCHTGDTTYDALQTAGDLRWGAMVNKPFVAFSGNNNGDITEASKQPIKRAYDKVNCVISAPNCPNLPFAIAAAAAAAVAESADADPARDYGHILLKTLTAPDSTDSWDWATRDQAVKLGLATTHVRDGVITLSDIITCYHPAASTEFEWRYVCDFMKLCTITYNIDKLFNNAEWDGAPLIPDHQATTNRNAKKPKMAVAEVCSMIDNLGNAAVISDPDFSKAGTMAEIDQSNSKRLNLYVPTKLSGNVNIFSADLDFSFYVG